MLVGTFFYLNYISTNYFKTVERFARLLDKTYTHNRADDPRTQSNQPRPFNPAQEFVCYATARFIDAQTRLQDEINRRGGLSRKWYVDVNERRFVRLLSPEEAKYASVPPYSQLPPKQRTAQPTDLSVDGLQFVDDTLITRIFDEFFDLRPMNEAGTSAQDAQLWEGIVRDILDENQVDSAKASGILKKLPVQQEFGQTAQPSRTLDIYMPPGFGLDPTEALQPAPQHQKNPIFPEHVIIEQRA